MIVCTQNTKFIRAVNAAMETSKSHEIEKVPLSWKTVRTEKSESFLELK